MKRGRNDVTFNRDGTKPRRFVYAGDLRGGFEHLVKALRQEGHSWKEIKEFFSGFDPAPSLRLLMEWGSPSSSTRRVLSVRSPHGRPHKLEEWQARLLFGFVIDQFEDGKESTLLVFKDFLRTSFGIDVSQSTVRRYIRGANLAKRVLKRRNQRKIPTNDEQVVMAYDFVRAIPVDLDPSRVCSVDFTFTSHRTSRPRAWAPRGRHQPARSSTTPRYTGCIVTCIWRDGVNRTPALLYTYNPAFRTDRRRTERRDRLQDELGAALQEYGLEDHRVVYMDSGRGNTRVYVSESAEILRDFFDFYKIGSEMTVFSDEGNAFKEGSADVFESIGVNTHYKYPPEVHHYLSPNDNGVHGPAKAAWREMCGTMVDDVRTSLFLLKKLDEFSEQSDVYFSRCMPNDRGNSLRAAMAKLVRDRDDHLLRLFDRYRYEYRVDAGLATNTDEPDLPRELDDGLDGWYWVDHT